MIAVIKADTKKDQRDHLIEWLEAQGVKVDISEGKDYTVLGLVGDTEKIDVELLESLNIVESVKRISEPFKKANRKFHPENSIVKVGDAIFGDGSLTLIAGPSSVESEEQIITIAKSVKESGAKLLRGGAFKPRSSPYAFQGLKADGIELLLKARKETGLGIVSEITDINHIDLYMDIDMIQVGARNMQNTELLRELGRTKKPILLKKGYANTLKELLMSAEYIMAEGNPNVVLCERGLRTFEEYTKYTLDVSSVPIIHKLSHLPIIVDPGMGTGSADLVAPMSLASVAAGADGIMIEVHNDPLKALSDGSKCVKPEEFRDIASRAFKIKEALK